MTDEKERLEQLRKAYPNQIPAKELYQPDPPGKSMQGPMEVVQLTFAALKKGERRG